MNLQFKRDARVINIHLKLPTCPLTAIPNENRTDICVFGKCFYCKESEPVCGDESGLLEGAMLQVIPGTLAKYRSPWQRTYKDNQKAEWEDNMNYCGY